MAIWADPLERMSMLSDYFEFLLLFFVVEPVPPPMFAFFLAARLLRRLAAGFFSPEFDVIAVFFGFAGGFAFLFCAANALVPARANANTALIRILFIIVLRRIFSWQTDVRQVVT